MEMRMSDKIINTGGGGNTAVGLIAGIALVLVVVIGLFVFGGFGKSQAPTHTAGISVDVKGK
jgi:hypothetical protein